MDCFIYDENVLSYIPSHSHSLRDRASHNDVIGTTHLCMSRISAPGGDIEGRQCFVVYKLLLKIQFDWRLLLSAVANLESLCLALQLLYSLYQWLSTFLTPKTPIVLNKNQRHPGPLPGWEPLLYTNRLYSVLRCIKCINSAQLTTSNIPAAKWYILSIVNSQCKSLLQSVLPKTHIGWARTWHVELLRQQCCLPHSLGSQTASRNVFVVSVYSIYLVVVSNVSSKENILHL